ncbi:guanitoxin biosynthesis L-enduracididine beta-hydroxylase GntD [Streptomyces sp. NPDC057682]|uniref:guanitoxin biosynthesis L-enduracididine beta-hydroxylase GntD n=1 Tax=unclassified Streptomyces TaxID=2593676 RepID=UPI003665E0F2
MLTQAPQAVVPAPGRTRTLELRDGEAAAVHALAARTARVHRSVDDPAFLREVNVIAHELPRRLRSFLNQARLDDTGHAVVVSGHHVDHAAIGPTPAHWSETDTPRTRTHAFLLMLEAALLGDVIGWATQQDGRLVTDVLPTPGQEDSQISSSSHAALGWHTEDAFSPSRGDRIGLYCLRNPDATPTTVSYPAPEAVDRRVRDILRQPRFVIEPDPSHVLRGRGTALSPVALLTGPWDAPVLRIDRDFTSALPGDDEAAAALRALIAHLDANLYELPLRPGDVCFVDNRNVVHGRSPFRPRYDGTDRWLKRVNLVADLRRTRPERSSSTTRTVGR